MERIVFVESTYDLDQMANKCKTDRILVTQKLPHLHALMIETTDEEFERIKEEVAWQVTQQTTKNNEGWWRNWIKLSGSFYN